MGLSGLSNVVKLGGVAKRGFQGFFDYIFV